MKASLPNRVLYDDELDRWGRAYIDGFRGTHSRTSAERVIPHMRPGDSVILNLDPRYAHGGTHWVALRVSKWAPLAYYKDSFGAPPPEDVARAVSQRGLGLVYGNRMRQKIKEENCGKRAAEWLRDMSRAGPREIELFVSSET